MTSSSLDALKRRPVSATRTRTLRRRSWLVLPGLILGFAVLSFFLFGERLRPRLAVNTAPALLLETSSSAAETPDTGTPQTLSQASGWIEPDPYPIRVPARVNGLVETVEVLAGEQVKAGQLLATLDPTDFELLLERLLASLQAAEAQREEKKQSIVRAQAEYHRARAEIAAADAHLTEVEDRLRRVQALDPGVIPEDTRLQVERDMAVAKAEREAAEASLAGHLAHQEVEKAGEANAKARVRELGAQVAQARVNLERTEIRSPIDGVVLRRYAQPGGMRMLSMDNPESSTIVSLYNPAKLQVRVDVPLADVSSVVPGMPARIKLSAFPEREFAGRVTRIVGEADLTRNTLQVKVAVENPDPRMRPEMLCRVEFFKLPADGTPPGVTFRGPEAVWIPEAALREGDQVWVVDPVKLRLEKRSLSLGGQTREGYRQVTEGLRPGERVVLEPVAGLKEGLRVKESEGELK